MKSFKPGVMPLRVSICHMIVHVGLFGQVFAFLLICSVSLFNKLTYLLTYSDIRSKAYMEQQLTVEKRRLKSENGYAQKYR